MRNVAGAYREDVLEYAAAQLQTAPEYLFRRSPQTAVLRHAGSGKWFAIIMPVSREKLGLALGFTSRQALLNYQAKREFVDTITRAKSRIEQYAEERLFDRDGTAGAQFSLKNNFTGWNREKEIDAESTEKLIERVGQLLGATDSVID